MAALNFPTTNLFNGKTYTGDNGITYTYQDGKWIGSGTVSSTISDHLHHGDFNLTLNDDGTVQFPNYKFPVADGASGQVLTTDGSGILSFAAGGIGVTNLDSLTDVVITSAANGQFLKYDGSNWVNSSSIYTLPIANTNSLGGIKVGSGLNIDGGTGVLSVTGGVNTGNYSFSGNDLTLPNNARLNGGHFLTNSPEFGTTATINVMQVMHSEIYMGAGTAESRAIVDDQGRGLMYLGVENVGAGKFAGIVARDPNTDGSQYSPGLNVDGMPTIGPGSNSYATAVGVMNDGFVINGLFADGNQTIVSGGTGDNSSIKLVDNGITLSANGHSLALTANGTLTIPGSLVSTQLGTMRFTSDVDFEIEANNRIKLLGAPLNLAEIAPAEVLGRSGDMLVDSNDLKIKTYDGVRWNEVVTTHGASKDIVVGAGANFRKSTGERVAYHNEVPTDISQLSDRTGMIPTISQETINIDGGGAYAMFETALRADGGFSGSRWGAASTVFDGGATAGTTVFELALNGGGA